MKHNILDSIGDDSIEKNEKFRRGSTTSTSHSDSDDNSSAIIAQEDAEALRLDTPDDAIPIQETRRELFYLEDEDDALDPAKNIGLTERPKKKVRFNRATQSENLSDQETALYPWELKKVIRKEFREKLPNNYEIKRWKKPSKVMINSVIQLLETNVQNSIEQVFEKYRNELQNVTHENNQEIDRFHRQKQSIMNDIIAKIKLQLKKSRFPSRISEQDLDIEYIVSKRRFIQKRYAEELANAERVEYELFKEQQLLAEARGTCDQVKEDNRTKITETLIKNNLHPSLSKAVENAYGLIKDFEAEETSGKQVYLRDISELNVQLPQDKAPPNELYEKISNLLPALKDLDKAAKELHSSTDKFNGGKQQIIKDLFMNE